MITKLPGIFTCIVLALVARWLHTLPIWPFTIAGSHYIDEIVIVILLGMLVRQFYTLPELLEKGINFSASYLLPFAIVLVGSQLNLSYALSLSGDVLLIILLGILFTLGFTFWLLRYVRVNQKLGILIAVGTAICGSAAIITTAPIIKAHRNYVALGVSMMAVFSMLAIITFPFIGYLFDMSYEAFAIWSGVSVQGVAQSIATGFAYADQSGPLTSLVKLTRVLWLAPIVIAISIWQTRRQSHHYPANSLPAKLGWQTYLPPFVLGFIIMMVLNTLGLFDKIDIGHSSIDIQAWLKQLADGLFLVAIAGIGLAINIKSLKRLGLWPFLLGIAAMIGLSVVSWVLIVILV